MSIQSKLAAWEDAMLALNGEDVIDAERLQIALMDC